jgi:hypothetical protein
MAMAESESAMSDGYYQACCGAALPYQYFTPGRQFSDNF